MLRPVFLQQLCSELYHYIFCLALTCVSVYFGHRRKLIAKEEDSTPEMRKWIML